MAINGQSVVAMKPGSVAPNGDEVRQGKFVVIKIVVVHRCIFFAPSLTVGFLPNGRGTLSDGLVSALDQLL